MLTQENTIPKISTTLWELNPPFDNVHKIPSMLLTSKITNAGFIGKFNSSKTTIIIAIGKIIPQKKKTAGTVSQYKIELKELNQLRSKLEINHTITERNQYAGNSKIHFNVLIIILLFL